MWFKNSRENVPTLISGLCMWLKKSKGNVPTLLIVLGMWLKRKECVHNLALTICG